MSEKLSTDALENVSGGASTSSKSHILIYNCERRVNVRQYPKDDTYIVAHAYLGSRYPFHGWVGNWAKATVDGKVGYIYKDFVMEVD